jgi:hypothetical protein
MPWGDNARLWGWGNSKEGQTDRKTLPFGCFPAPLLSGTSEPQDVSTEVPDSLCRGKLRTTMELYPGTPTGLEVDSLGCDLCTFLSTTAANIHQEM